MTPMGIPPPDALRQRIESAIAETPASRFGRGPRLAVAVVTVLVVLAIGLLTMRPDLRAMPAASLAGVTLGVTFLAVGTLVVALAPGSRGLGAPVTALVILAVTTAPLYAILTLSAPIGDATHAPKTLACFRMSIFAASLALVGLTASLRRSVPAAPNARGALIGACAGAWAGLVIHVHCPCPDRLHIALGHALPIAIFSIVGALVTPRFLRP